MQLKSLNIWRNEYDFPHGGTPPGGVGGKITFTGAGGEVTVNLTSAHTAQILAICANAMVEQTKTLAESLTRETIEHAGLALAPPPEPVTAGDDPFL